MENTTRFYQHDKKYCGRLQELLQDRFDPFLVSAALLCCPAAPLPPCCLWTSLCQPRSDSTS